ncbi:methyl-accepting chemotaxis protein [Gellertiella hungarica]|uniref:Methyl-accepting chemotaxis protein n=1 Tax=Gellertiella hungarica TaxID=1572859 RepID=A0A7W6J4D6_9HYPH|nr:HAMP domain-containing methyl-accepting chemotaxis protein [Gellertiella hungarica]MBB4064589.1 methyl-accepting chemotaxis protein [Gellertiella hungarica]
MILDHVRLGKAVPAAIIGLVLVSTGILAGSDYMSAQQLRRSMTIAEEQERAQDLARLITDLQLRIELDIVSTQESLTDISATRGMDGLDDGFALAAGSAKSLHEKVDKLKALSQEAGLNQMVPVLDSLSERFDRFHQTGIEMAKAYMSGGPEAGNPLMGQFDKVCDDLQAEIDATGKIVGAYVDRLEEAASVNTAALEAEAAALFRLMCGLAALMLCCGIGLSIFVSRRLMRPLVKATEAMNALAEGHVDRNLDGLERGDEIGDLARAYRGFQENLLAKRRAEREEAELREAARATRLAAEAERSADLARTKAVVDSLGSALGSLAAGQLGIRISSPFEGDYDRLRVNFNQSAERLQLAIQGIITVAHDIQNDSSVMRTSASQLANRTEQQAAALEETASALNQITSTVRDTASRAENAGHKVEQAHRQAHESDAVVQKAIAAMGHIEESARQISQIIGVIDEIAFQTNLLALNAGVEAARAGEAGKGFAVVAQEMRELAQRSANAAKEIKNLIQRSEQAVGSGVSLVNETGDILRIIQTQVSAIHEDIVAIIHSAREQATGLHEINAAMTQMDEFTQHNAGMVVDSNHTVQRLAEGAGTLYHQVSQFRVDKSGYARAA